MVISRGKRKNLTSPPYSLKYSLRFVWVWPFFKTGVGGTQAKYQHTPPTNSIVKQRL